MEFPSIFGTLDTSGINTFNQNYMNDALSMSDMLNGGLQFGSLPSFDANSVVPSFGPLAGSQPAFDQPMATENPFSGFMDWFGSDAGKNTLGGLGAIANTGINIWGLSDALTNSRFNRNQAARNNRLENERRQSIVNSW